MEGFTVLTRGWDTYHTIIKQLTDRIAALEGGTTLAAQQKTHIPIQAPPPQAVYVPHQETNSRTYKRSTVHNLK